MKSNYQIFKFALTLFLLISLGRLAVGQTVYYGHVGFSNQSWVDSFGVWFPDVTHIAGSVRIGPAECCELNPATAINNLDGLSNVRSVSGSMFVVNTGFLEDLSGLEHLDTLGGSLWVQDNRRLRNTDALDGLIYNGPGTSPWTSISRNDSLESVVFPQGITQVGRLEIVHNPKLIQLPSGLSSVDTITDRLQINHCGIIDLNGLSGLSYLESVYVHDNPNLTSLDGIGNFDYHNNCMIFNNPSLAHIDALTDITSHRRHYSSGGDLTISNNPALTHLPNFTQLDSLDKVRIGGCASLTDVTGLANWTAINRIELENNDKLTHIDLPNLQFNHQLHIWGCEQLTSVGPFAQLSQGTLYVRIARNPALTTITGFHAVTDSLGSFTCLRNPRLEYLEVFSRAKATRKGRVQPAGMTEHVSQHNQFNNIIISNSVLLDSIPLASELVINSFDSLRYTGGISIVASPLTDVSGFNQLVTVGVDAGTDNDYNRVGRTLSFSWNDSLEQVSGFSQLRKLRCGLSFWHNPRLNLSGAFPALDTLVDVIPDPYYNDYLPCAIWDHEELVDISFLEGLTLGGPLDYFSFWENTLLQEIPVFKNLDAPAVSEQLLIRDNPALRSIPGYPGLGEVLRSDRFQVTNNPNLEDISGLCLAYSQLTNSEAHVMDNDSFQLWNNGPLFSTTDSIFLYCDPIIDTDEVDASVLKSSCTLSPNPGTAGGQLTLACTDIPQSYQWLDTNGRTLAAGAVRGGQVRIPAEFPAGLYLLRLDLGQRWEYQRVIVQ